MITIFGIGTAGSNIASLFREHKNYNIVTFTTQEESEVEGHIRLESGSTPNNVKTTFPTLQHVRLLFLIIYRSSSVGLPFR